jgi:hypothetical protein
LGCAKKTVERKFEFVARICRARHLHALRTGEFWTDQVSFDEMETYELTKLLPLSIAIAVTEGGKIIETQVAEMKCKGPLASMSLNKYGHRDDQRKAACKRTLRKVARILASPVEIFTIKTDQKTGYITSVANELPGVRHERYERKVKALYGTHIQNKTEAPYGLHSNGRPFDPMFMLNQRCAKIRSQLSRMRRRFWGATKKKKRLEMHLWLFTSWQNEYEIKASYC